MTSAAAVLPVTNLLEARALTRTFNRRRVVDNVSLTAAAGECFVIFGPNGAGKTTLLRLLAGLLRPDSGSAHVMGRDPRGDSGARSVLGLVGHQTMLYDTLTALENVHLAGVLHRLPQPLGRARTALALTGAETAAGTRIRALSRGMQQRVALARALVHAPMVLLADEPFTGLDETGVTHMRAALRAVLERGGAVVLVTHNLVEGLTLATRAAVMCAGRIIREDERAGVDAATYAREYRQLASHVA